MTNMGFSRRISRYDQRGNSILDICYDTKDAPCLCVDGYAYRIAQYDEKGKWIEFDYFNEDSIPCLCTNGYSKQRIKYDDKDNLVEESYYGIDSLPCLCKSGYATIQYTYNERNEIVSRLYYDTSNQLIGNYMFAMLITGVSGVIQELGIPANSLIVKWNDWTIGDSQKKYSIIQHKSHFGEKDVYVLTSAGEIKHAYIKQGLFGIYIQPYYISLSQLNEILPLLEMALKK